MQTAAVAFWVNNTDESAADVEENKQKQTHPLLLSLHRAAECEPIIPPSSSVFLFHHKVSINEAGVVWAAEFEENFY